MELEKYNILQIEWTPAYNKEITEIYRMLKDQERKIFDLSWYDMGGDILNYLEGMIKKSAVFIVSKDDDICAFFILENPRMFKDIIIRTDVHTVVRKKYWGKQSRDIMNLFKSYLLTNYKIKKLIASVPQCGYGVIKLLKDIGFKHEGTIKQALLFKDKNDIPKFYDELIYSFTNEDL
nr:MAG TPA: Diamine N-acetyltransferase [Caudoviricetes sp.]